MKKKNFTLVITFFFLVGSWQLNGNELSLDPKDCHHVSFEGINPTQYSYNNKTKVLTANVKQSSSILVIPFDSVEKVKQVSFMWKASGQLPSTELQTLTKKQGDDALLRIGLLKHGEPPMFSFTAPAWLKKVSDILKHPSDQLLYLVAGLKDAGLTWKSPYSNTIEQIAVKTQQDSQSWSYSNHTFKEQVPIVGIWIIADGDDSKLSFRTELKALKIE